MYFAPNTESHLFSLILDHAGLNPFKPSECLTMKFWYFSLQKKAGAYEKLDMPGLLAAKQLIVNSLGVYATHR
jgi:hypothetical protein